MTLKTAVLILAPLLLVGGTHAGASELQPRPLASAGRLAAVLDSLVPAELAATRTPGAAVAIVIGDSLVYARGFGVASVETGLAVTSDMLFRIASTTKVLTAAAVLAATARESLALDAPVGSVLTDLSSSIGRLTLRDLLRHRAGLREGSSYYGPQDESALREFVRSWSDSMLFTEPGDVYSYSNLGYVLAGAVLGQAVGKPYSDAMSDLLFRPLGMLRSTLRPTEAMTNPLAQGHELRSDGSAAVVRPFSNDARYWPAGSVFTSATEFARFVTALLNRGRLDGAQVLPADVVDALLTRQSDLPGNAPAESAGYAFGLVVREIRGVRMYQHGGVRIGFGSLVRIIPQRRVGIVILSNRTNGLLMRTLEQATEMLVPASSASAAVQPEAPAPITDAEIAQAVGHYVNTPGELELELRAKDGKLWLRNPGTGGGEVPVTQTPDGRYRAGDQAFALVTGDRAGASYLFIAGHALRKR